MYIALYFLIMKILFAKKIPPGYPKAYHYLVIAANGSVPVVREEHAQIVYGLGSGIGYSHWRPEHCV